MPSAQRASGHNDSGDAGDATPNGPSQTAGGVCMLRAAIEESNRNAAVPDTIEFLVAPAVATDGVANGWINVEGGN